MRKLVYLNRAKKDLASIIDFIELAKGDVETGYRVAERIKAQCRKISTLPALLGRPRSELGPDLRSFPFESYLIFFRYADDRLEIIRIIRAQRGIGAVMGEEEP